MTEYSLTVKLITISATPLTTALDAALTVWSAKVSMVLKDSTCF